MSQTTIVGSQSESKTVEVRTRELIQQPPVINIDTSELSKRLKKIEETLIACSEVHDSRMHELSKILSQIDFSPRTNNTDSADKIVQMLDVISKGLVQIPYHMSTGFGVVAEGLSKSSESVSDAIANQESGLASSVSLWTTEKAGSVSQIAHSLTELTEHLKAVPTATYPEFKTKPIVWAVVAVGFMNLLASVGVYFLAQY
jgi:hypothetical protein